MTKDRCYLLQPLKVAVIYPHVPDDPQHASWAYNLAQTWQQHPPEYPHKFVFACAHRAPSQQMMDIMRPVNPQIFIHDDSGWDIGAYQSYAKDSTDDLLVFIGGSTYVRRAGWLARMVESFQQHEGFGLFGACGNTGDMRFNVFPHVRTTGFWCSPYIMNSYPMKVTHVSQRYEFEHGQHGISEWARQSGVPVKVIDFIGEYDFPKWNDGPNGYQRGDQRDLLVGDRLTAPPFFHCS